MTKSIDGLPVLDAKRPVKLTILPQDIKGADLKRPESCAAARALCRSLHATEARVHLGRVYVKTTKDHWTRYETPEALRAEIVAFDRGGEFEPGEFILKAPRPYAQKMRGRQQGSRRTQTTPWEVRKARQEANGYKPRPYHATKNVRTGPA